MNWMSISNNNIKKATHNGLTDTAQRLAHKNIKDKTDEVCVF